MTCDNNTEPRALKTSINKDNKFTDNKVTASSHLLSVSNSVSSLVMISMLSHIYIRICVDANVCLCVYIDQVVLGIQ